MRDWLEEVWMVFCHSKGTQWALAFGVLLFVGISALGEVMVGGLELHGPLAALTDAVGGKLMQRYDKAAWIALSVFVLLAIKIYRKDRRRLLGI